MMTPWGETQTIEDIAPGIVFVSTASHGGYKLTAKRYNSLPEVCRKTWAGSWWFEEDVDACIVFLAWPDEVQPDAQARAAATADARAILASCNPERLAALDRWHISQSKAREVEARLYSMETEPFQPATWAQGLCPRGVNPGPHCTDCEGQHDCTRF